MLSPCKDQGCLAHSNIRENYSEGREDLLERGGQGDLRYNLKSRRHVVDQLAAADPVEGRMRAHAALSFWAARWLSIPCLRRPRGVDRGSSAVRRAGRLAKHSHLAARDVVEQLETADPVAGRIRVQAALHSSSSGLVRRSSEAVEGTRAWAHVRKHVSSAKS